MNIKRIAFVLLVFLSTLILICVGVVGTFAYRMYRQIRPETYVNYLVTTPASYAQVNSIEPDRLDWFAYAYDENVFVDALKDTPVLPNVMDKQGRVPAFKLGNDIFVITHKWINDSSGLAISNDENFIAKIQSLDKCIMLWHERDNIYTWALDLERPHP